MLTFVKILILVLANSGNAQSGPFDEPSTFLSTQSPRQLQSTQSSSTSPTTDAPNVTATNTTAAPFATSATGTDRTGWSITDTTETTPTGRQLIEPKLETKKIGHIIGTGTPHTQNCTDDNICKAACGKDASDFQCNEENGNCICIRPLGPPRRCRNVQHAFEPCVSICGRKIAQICYTDCGNFCACFLRN